MNNISICLVLNIIIMIAFGIEMSNDYDVILDKSNSKSSRRKYSLRLIVSSAVSWAALIFVYIYLGVSSNDMIHYIIYGVS